MKEKTRKVILLVVICVFTLLVLLVSLKLNDNRKNEALLKSQMSDYLTEINYEEIHNYVVEQPSIIIYVSNSAEESTTDFEILFKPIIKRYNLENDIIYININGSTIVDLVYQNSPELIIYKDGQMSDIIDCTTLKNQDQIIKALKERGVIND